METGRMHRKQKKEFKQQLRSENPGLEVVNPRAAGIDVGNSAYYVAVRPDRDPDSVRRLEWFTADLHHLADWLESCGVETVAMQSTGVYWIPLYETWSNAVSGCIWSMRGIPRICRDAKAMCKRANGCSSCIHMGCSINSFQPTAEIRVTRSYWRQRSEHTHGASSCVQRMQKALTQMNVQLANVISDLEWVTGQAIVRAILAGERNPSKLAELSHSLIRASHEEIARSLEGNWRPELLFVLKQETEMYDQYRRRIAECDRELEAHLKNFADRAPTKPANQDLSPHQQHGHPARAPRKTLPRDRKSNAGTRPGFDLTSELYRICGVDLTRIDGQLAGCPDGD